MNIRLATPEDLAAINEIYNHYVMHSTCTYQDLPSTKRERAAWYEGHDAAHPITVLVVPGAATAREIVGWASLSAFHPRAAYRHSVESSIYIHHQHQRRGYGRALMVDLIARGRRIGHHTILAGISADQTASVALHAALGFAEVARFQEVGRKFDRWLDVVWMQLML